MCSKYLIHKTLEPGSKFLIVLLQVAQPAEETPLLLAFHVEEVSELLNLRFHPPRSRQLVLHAARISIFVIIQIINKGMP